MVMGTSSSMTSPASKLMSSSACPPPELTMRTVSLEAPVFRDEPELGCAAGEGWLFPFRFESSSDWKRRLFGLVKKRGSERTIPSRSSPASSEAKSSEDDSDG